MEWLQAQLLILFHVFFLDFFQLKTCVERQNIPVLVEFDKLRTTARGIGPKIDTQVRISSIYY